VNELWDDSCGCPIGVRSLETGGILIFWVPLKVGFVISDAEDDDMEDVEGRLTVVELAVPWTLTIGGVAGALSDSCRRKLTHSSAKLSPLE